MQHKRDRRIVFYLNDEEAERLDEATSDAGLSRADYLRQAVLGVSHSAANGADDAPAIIRTLEESLADARQSKDRLEQLLLQSQTTVSDLARALPAAGESSASRSWSWQFWKR